MAEIPEAVRTQLVEHCRSVLPNEACGYLVGDATTGAVARFVPIANAAASPTRFRFDPYEQLAAEQAIDEAGEQVIGIAHSHPVGEPRPSAVDIADAERFDPFGTLLHVIVAPTTGVVRAYRIIDGAVSSVALRSSPAEGAPMDLATDFTDALDRHDIDAAVAMYRSDAEIISFDGTASGADQIRAFLAGFRAAHDRYELVTISQQQRTGDVAVWDASVDTGAGVLQVTNVMTLDSDGRIARHVPLIRGFWGKS